MIEEINIKNDKKFYIEANNKLNQKYTQWLEQIRKTCPELLENKYSNPYYISIPSKWYQSENRILIVGEEGHGTWGCGKTDGILADDILSIQKFNKDYLESQLGYSNRYSRNESPFWKRIRKTSQYGVCSWSNIDKIHVLGKGNCQLSEKERTKLHSVDIKILNEEIKILQPTHIIFFGFYGISLKHECPEIFKELYPGGLGDNSKWFKTVVPINYEGKWYIFSYHPAWGCRTKGYEEKVLKVIETCIE